MSIGVTQLVWWVRHSVGKLRQLRSLALPAIVTEDQFDAWLDPKESRPAKLLPLLIPYPVEKMEKWVVSRRVNSAREDEPALLSHVAEPKKPKWVQPSLFDVA